MTINAVFVKSTKEILYSRARHDFVSSADNEVSVDGGFDYVSVTGSPDNYVSIQLNGDVLLEQILQYDHMYGNRRADMFPDGYYGRFAIVKNSNLNFYKKLVINFKNIVDLL